MEYHLIAEKEIWYFPSLSEYVSLLVNNGFKVTYAVCFERETLLEESNGLKNWLQMFAKPYLDHLEKQSIDEVLTDVERKISSINYREGKWYADYIRLRFVAIKE